MNELLYDIVYVTRYVTSLTAPALRGRSATRLTSERAKLSTINICFINNYGKETNGVVTDGDGHRPNFIGFGDFLLLVLLIYRVFLTQSNLFHVNGILSTDLILNFDGFQMEISPFYHDNITTFSRLIV